MKTYAAQLKLDQAKQELAILRENAALYEKTGDSRLEKTRKRIGELETQIAKQSKEGK